MKSNSSTKEKQFEQALKEAREAMEKLKKIVENRNVKPTQVNK